MLYKKTIRKLKGILFCHQQVFSNVSNLNLPNLSSFNLTFRFPHSSFSKGDRHYVIVTNSSHSALRAALFWGRYCICPPWVQFKEERQMVGRALQVPQHGAGIWFWRISTLVWESSNSLSSSPSSVLHSGPGCSCSEGHIKKSRRKPEGWYTLVKICSSALN